MEVSNQPFERDTNENLLNKSPDKLRAARERRERSEKKLVLNEYENDLSS
jgi:hypothetical protein